MGFMPLKRGPKVPAPPFPHVRSKKASVFEAERKPSLYTKFAGASFLDFMTSRTVGNKFMLFTNYPL
jgi:hypothetical protein